MKLSSQAERIGQPPSSQAERIGQSPSSRAERIGQSPSSRAERSGVERSPLSSCVLFLIFLVFTSPLHAEDASYTEASVGVYAASRLLTLGAVANWTNERALWGQRGEMANLRYGYWRAAVDFFTSVSTTVVEPTLEIYPVPILGLGGGGQWNYSFVNSTEVTSCGQALVCKGLVQWTYGSMTLQGAYRNLFAKVLFNYGHLEHGGHPRTEFFASSAVVTAPAEGSDVRAWSATTGLNIDDRWKVGVYGSRYFVLKNDTSAQKLLAFGSYGLNRWSYNLGAGVSKASVFKNYKGWNTESGPLVFFQINYNLQSPIDR